MVEEEGFSAVRDDVVVSVNGFKSLGFVGAFRRRDSVMEGSEVGDVKNEDFPVSRHFNHVVVKMDSESSNLKLPAKKDTR